MFDVPMEIKAEVFKSMQPPVKKLDPLVAEESHQTVTFVQEPAIKFVPLEDHPAIEPPKLRGAFLQKLGTLRSRMRNALEKLPIPFQGTRMQIIFCFVCLSC